MTTSRQISANRQNARYSTGPRSNGGKVRSARNARRHGLTEPPPFEDVLIWYRSILDDSDALPFVGGLDDAQYSAWRLAETEVHLKRCLEAERSHANLVFERAMDNSDFWRTSVKERMERNPADSLIWRIWANNADGQDDPILVGAARILARSSEGRPAALHEKARILRRYRREAESRRLKALQLWLEGEV